MLKHKDLLSLKDLSAGEIQEIFSLAKVLKKKRVTKDLEATVSRCGDDRWDPENAQEEQCDGAQHGTCGTGQRCISCRCFSSVTSPTTTTRTTTTRTTATTTTTTTATSTTFEPECGNGIKEGTEQCDRKDLGGYTCPDGSRPAGLCDADCMIDPGACPTSIR